MRHWRQMGWGGKGEWVGWKVVVDCGTSKRVHDDKVNFSIATQPATRSKLRWHMCPQGFGAVALSTMVLWVNVLHKTLSFAGTIIGHVFVLELGPLLFCAFKIVRARIRAHIARGEPDKVREELERIVQLLCCCVFLLKAVLLDFYDTEQL